MVGRTTLLDLLVYVGKMFLWAAVVFVIVLAIDVVILGVFNLLADLGAWYILLFIEGLVMMALGAGGVWHEHPAYWTSPLGERLYRVEVKFQWPWFWASVGMAGFALWLLIAYLYLHT